MFIIKIYKPMPNRLVKKLSGEKKDKVVPVQ